MRKLKITSLILVVVMLLGMIPMGIFSASAAVAEPTTFPSTRGDITSFELFDVTNTSPVYGCAQTDAMGGVSTGIDGLWRDGGEGVMLKVQTGENPAKFVAQIQVEGGGFAAGSYGRMTTPYDAIVKDDTNTQKHYNANLVGSLKSDVYLYDGEKWEKQTIINSQEKMWVTIPANFDGYFYVPFDQLYWLPNGSLASTGAEKAAYYDYNAVEILRQYGNPDLNNVHLMMNRGDTITVSSTKVVMTRKQVDLAPDDSWDKEPFEWKSNLSQGGMTLDKAYYGMQEGKTETKNKLNDKIVMSTIPYGNAPGSGVWANSSYGLNAETWTGVSMKVDATAQPTNQLRLRPWLQTHTNIMDTEYATGMIINNSGNGNFQDLSTTTSYMQFVCDTYDAIAYYRADGVSEWTEIRPTFAKSTNTNGYYLLPAGFKGEVYIPMESYWMTHKNNGGTIMFPFDEAPSYEVYAWGGFSTWNTAPAAGSSAALTLSDMTIWRSTDDVKIGTAEELIYFFDHLNEYNGKKVILTNDIILNDGWLASSGTAPGVQLGARTDANSYFAGTFDGQGHVISGLYLESDITALGLFGVVNHKTQATVKNVSIVNSYVKHTNTAADPGNYKVVMFPSVGAIFGQVMGDMTEQNTYINYNNLINETKATIKNVYCDVDVYSTNTNSGAVGAGGFVGILQSDLVIDGSTYAGTLSSGMRGTAAFVGAIYPPQKQAWDHDGDGATRAFYPKDTNGDGKIDTKDTAVYYKNNDSEKAVVGTKNISWDTEEVDLYVYNSIFSGSITNRNQGFTGGIVGYNNTQRANVTASNLIMTGSIFSPGDRVGYIMGGTWASPSAEGTTIGHGKHWQDYVLFNVNVVEDATDNCTKNVGLTSNAVKVWGGDNTAKKWASNGNVAGYVNVVEASALPTVLKTTTYFDAMRYEVSLNEALALTIKIPVGRLILNPGVEISDVLTGMINNKDVSEGTTARLSADGAYWEFVFDDVLPQDISSLKFNVNIAKGKLTDGTVKSFNYGLNKNDLTNKLKADKISIEDYLRTLIADATLSTETHDLAADLLKYCSATQKFHGLTAIDTSTLDAGYGYVAEDIVGEYEYEAPYISTDEHSFVQLAFRCDSKLALQIDVSAAGAYTATLDGEALEVDTSKAADGYILIYLNPLVWDAELQVTDPNTAAVLFYTLPYYFSWVLEEDNGIAQRQKDVVTALFNYMMSAQAYADSIAE